MANLPVRLTRALNVFRMTAETFRPSVGMSYGQNPDRAYLTGGNERSIISALYNRIAIDVAAINIYHCKLTEEGQYDGLVEGPLNYCLTVAANIDQTARQFIQDLVMTMFDEGVAAIVPVDFEPGATETSSLRIFTMRVGRIVEWYPSQVKVRLYNDRTGNHEEVMVPKTFVAIVQNPLYAVMNEPNSTLQRLIRKLNLLDAVDEQASSGKLDLIIQLPYQVRSDARRQQAEERRKDSEHQLKDSKYGIAYIGETEHVTQLNRPVENNLLEQVKYLTTELYGQLGISENITNGTASEEEMLNYHNRTIEPIISSICDAMKCKFLSKTALTQGQTIMFFRDPFKLAPINQIAELADKFTRNEIMSSNEFRSKLGLRRVDDPAADELRNKNLNKSDSGSDESGQNGNQIDAVPEQKTIESSRERSDRDEE